DPSRAGGGRWRYGRHLAREADADRQIAIDGHRALRAVAAGDRPAGDRRVVGGLRSEDHRGLTGVDRARAARATVDGTSGDGSLAVSRAPDGEREPLRRLRTRRRLLWRAATAEDRQERPRATEQPPDTSPHAHLQLPPRQVGDAELVGQACVKTNGFLYFS